jgi:superfamily I DNA/RNA helicase
MPPAELLDLILDESAYAIESAWSPAVLRPRKTSRRFAPSSAGSRTGATRRFARIADHLDRLAVGDEPNAVIDAFDAVSLMTIHAAKGLEFPVVFIVNAARGNRQPPGRHSHCRQPG